jgi:hypothetical protein
MEAVIKAINVIGMAKIPIIAVGLVGNFLSFLVFSRKTFRNYSIGVYCRALAIADSFILYRLVFDLFNYLNNTTLSYQSDFLCKLNGYMQIGLSPISIWVLVAFSVDKMINVFGRAQRFFIHRSQTVCFF